MRKFLLPFTLAALACVPAVQAQDVAALATKPFTIVAPFPPGGPVDTLARMLADGLAAQYKQTAIVENKPGAAGNIGIDQVKRSVPTGHTLLVIPAGNLTINPTLMPAAGLNILGDFAPVSSLARAANVVAVNPAVPAKTIAELVTLAKAKPNSVAYATPGVGSQLHLAGELLGQQAGADFLHVAYKGSGPGLNDVLGGTVPMIIGNLPVLLPHIQAGKLRPLAVTDATRDPNIPNVPTLAEAGVPGIAVTSWYGVLAPKATPPAVVEQLAKDINRILTTPANQARLEQQGLHAWLVTTGAFGDLIRKETATWAPIIRTRKIEAQ
ncbi:tripartite tricarboxylate transporter substrate binding protein [Ramlibacter sp. XY19]|uniref:Bug family tripartite tricarboxylate transporter substrate binding protein n=1 Tax=Ramlibacter paludis TaxID=2908000 RepID=UPI0023DA56C4|nr:tripartite tricarboxylate transporter substrate binding protein [Ramlibacter paludis]MCG2594275.1 tripartite tricarboxylate transporter substrate binding protein [Ramlibacter paludis]